MTKYEQTETNEISPLAGQIIKRCWFSVSRHGNTYINIETESGMVIDIMVDQIQTVTVNFPQLNQQIADAMTALEPH